VRPETTIGLPLPDVLWPPGEAVTVYEVIAAPPLEAGGVKLTVAWPLPGVADTPVGAPGAEGNGGLTYVLKVVSTAENENQVTVPLSGLA
jgi:hypothetical protein